MVRQLKDDEDERTVPAVLPQDIENLKKEIVRTGAKTVLEFGPGATTQAMLDAGVERIVTCEHIDKWLDVARERFANDDRVNVLKYYDDMPCVVEGLADTERFDLGLVDSPKGFNPVRKVHPEAPDCSRLNTLVYAVNHCKVVLLHDATRPLERASLFRLYRSGAVDIEFIMSQIPMARITKRAQKPHRPDSPDIAQPGSAPAGAESKRRRKPVNRRSDRPDPGGTENEASVSN